MSLSALIVRLKSALTLTKFNLKRRFLSLDLTHLRPNSADLRSNDFWDQTFFPNYSSLTTEARAQQPSTKAGLGSTGTRLGSEFYAAGSKFQSYAAPLTLLWSRFLSFASWLLNAFRRSVGDGIIYIRGLVILFFFDAMLTDDEPIWEPVEWSLVQSWILFIFAFAWIAENLISSRYGSYTGRDKRVWVAWYKTFWLIEGWYILSLGAAALFVIVPFYHEITYTLPLIVSWWNWYSRVFFFKFISLYALILYTSYYLQLNVGTFHWRKCLLLILVVNMFLSYLLYTHFIMSFFAYFTDPNWYHKTRLVDYIQLSHEPNKWSWGNSKRDHFSYHNSKTVFWFKNDGPFASAFLVFHIMFFICLFALYIYWLTLFRRVYATQEITYTYTTYCVSALRQFFYYFLLLYVFVAFSFVVNYWRLPIEYAWIGANTPLLDTFIRALTDYPTFLINILV